MCISHVGSGDIGVPSFGLASDFAQGLPRAGVGGNLRDTHFRQACREAGSGRPLRDTHFRKIDDVAVTWQVHVAVRVSPAGGGGVSLNFHCLLKSYIGYS